MISDILNTTLEKMDHMHGKMEKFQQIDGNHQKESSGRHVVEKGHNVLGGPGLGWIAGVMEETLEQHLADTMKICPLSESWAQAHKDLIWAAVGSRHLSMPGDICSSL